MRRQRNRLISEFAGFVAGLFPRRARRHCARRTAGANKAKKNKQLRLHAPTKAVYTVGVVTTPPAGNGEFRHYAFDGRVPGADRALGK